MNTSTLFPDEPADIKAVCPTCQRTKFAPIAGTENRYRCRHCGWLVVVDASGQRDALDWRSAGKRGRK